MPALRPITSAGLRDEFNPLSTKDREDLMLFVVRQGAYRDVAFPRNRFTRLGALTAGSRASGGAQIRGGAV